MDVHNHVSCWNADMLRNRDSCQFRENHNETARVLIISMIYSACDSKFRP